MDRATDIPCPDCETPIPCDLGELLRGATFECPKCGVRISLAEESLGELRDSLAKFEALKSQPSEPDASDN